MVMDGFLRRICKSLGVDKVAIGEKGVFIVRFHNMENSDKVVNGGCPFFAGKPVILKLGIRILISREMK